MKTRVYQDEPHDGPPGFALLVIPLEVYDRVIDALDDEFGESELTHLDPERN